MASHKIKLVYWPIRARITLILLAAHKGNVDYEWDKATNWPALKEHTPFGQLPYLEDGPIKMGQSLAIARYIGRKGHLLGETDAEFAQSEQLIQQSDDIYAIINKAQAAKPRSEAHAAALAGPISAALHLTEKLLHGTTFTAGGKILLGDLAIFSVLYIIVTDIKHDYLDNFPKLKAFYDHVKADPSLKGFFALEIHPHFKGTDE